MSTPKFHDDDFNIQVLNPPLFEPSGKLLDRKVAWKDGKWFGSFNLWIVQSVPVPSIIYQLRSPTIGWAPNKLDVAVAGHYENLDTVEDTIQKELKEELGKEYKISDLIALGRRLNVGVGQDGSVRNSVSDLYLIEDNRPLDTYFLQKKEVYAICSCPLSELLKVHTIDNYTYHQKAIKHDKSEATIDINKSIFPPNWDPYHYKMALLIDQYFKGNKNLIY
jgi:hypothetical protein